MQATDINVQAISIKLDQLDIRLKNLESPDESKSWEDSSSQIKIPKEPINDPPNSSTILEVLIDKTTFGKVYLQTKASSLRPKWIIQLSRSITSTFSHWM